MSDHLIAGSINQIAIALKNLNSNYARSVAAQERAIELAEKQHNWAVDQAYGK